MIVLDKHDPTRWYTVSLSLLIKINKWINERRGDKNEYHETDEKTMLEWQLKHSSTKTIGSLWRNLKKKSDARRRRDSIASFDTDTLWTRSKEEYDIGMIRQRWGHCRIQVELSLYGAGWAAGHRCMSMMKASTGWNRASIRLSACSLEIDQNIRKLTQCRSCWYHLLGLGWTKEGSCARSTTN